MKHASRITRAVRVGLSTLFLLVAFSGIVRADVLRIRIDGPIHPIAEEYIARAIQQATQQHSGALLIELNTPGGLVESTRGIVKQILASPVPVVVYVGPTGSRAASAGFFILESADVAAMAPGTNTGAAHPVELGGGKMDDVMKSKVENDAAAFLRSYVAKRGRNTELAETAVRESKSWTDQEALSQKLTEIVSSNDDQLLRDIDGRTISRFDGSKVTLRTANQPVHTLPLTLRQQILGWLMDPNVAFMVLAIGALALYTEFNHPGAVVPGVIGVIFILLAIFALNLLPTRFAALSLVLLAFILFALEAKFASHGVLGIGGIVALTLGGLLLVDGPIPEMRVKLLTALSVSIPLGIITVFLMTVALRARRNKVTTGVQGLIGEIGLAQTELAPLGKIFINGELWNARSTSPVSAGTRVRVLRISGLELEVEAVANSASRTA